MDSRDLAAKMAGVVPATAYTGPKPKQIIGGRSYYSLLGLLVGMVLGSGVIWFAWSGAIRNDSCHGSHPATCELLKSIPYPIPEMVFDLFGCMAIVGLSIGFIKNWSGSLRVAVFEDHLEWINGMTLIAMPYATLQVAHSVIYAGKTTIENLEFHDEATGNTMIMMSSGTPRDQWKAMKTMASQLPHYQEVSKISDRLASRVKAFSK